MKKITLTELFCYPIKSTRRIKLECSLVENSGLKHDRAFAVVGRSGKILTARENKNLLRIHSRIMDSNLILSSEGTEEIMLSINIDGGNSNTEVQIFKDQVRAIQLDHQVNVWLSDILEEPCFLVKVDTARLREMKSKYNGQPGDFIGFKDASAIHLVSEASITELNKNLAIPTSQYHFRPNLVVTGITAFEEENWNRIKIGECEFELAVKTARCKMITIDPNSIIEDKNQEPLRTLSKIKTENHKVNFGVYLIPRKLGKINVGDEIIPLE